MFPIAYFPTTYFSEDYFPSVLGVPAPPDVSGPVMTVEVPSSIDVYDVGDIARIPVTFRVNGVFTDPGSIIMRLISPSGTVSQDIYPTNIVKTSVGSFYRDILVTERGDWHGSYRASFGVASGSEAFEFVCRPLMVPAISVPVVPSISFSFDTTELTFDSTLWTFDQGD